MLLFHSKNTPDFRRSLDPDKVQCGLEAVSKSSAMSMIEAKLEPDCVLFGKSGLGVIHAGSSRSRLLLSTFCSYQAITLRLPKVSVMSSKSSR